MKKFYAFLFVFFMTVGGLFAQSDVLLKGTGFTLTSTDPGQEGAYDLNPFIFHMAFMERAVYGLGLHKLVSPKDLPDISNLIFKSLNRHGAVKLVIQNFRGTQPLELNFYIKALNGKDYMICLSNYDEKENRILAAGEKLDDAWAMAYAFVGKKFVEHRYVLGLEKMPQKNRTAIANYYLQDADTQDDQRIEGLLLADIADSNNKLKGFTYAILTQYYLMMGQIEKAKGALNKIRDYKMTKGLSSDDIYFITSLELEATAKNYK